MGDNKNIKAKQSRKIKHIVQEKRTVSGVVLAKLLEPYMLVCMNECRDTLLLFLAPTPVRTANHGERVDKKGWAFNDIGNMRKRIDILIQADREGKSNWLNPYVRSDSAYLSDKSEDSLTNSSILLILKYLSSSRLDILILLEVILLETPLGTIASRYNVVRDYVTNHLRGCLAFIAVRLGACNTAAALPYIRIAEEMKLKNTPKIRRIRLSVCKTLGTWGKYLVHEPAFRREE